MSVSRLRVGLDARPLSNPQAGGFRSYVRSLVRGLRERAEAGADDLSLLLYIDRPLPPEVEATLPPGAETRILSPDRIASDFAHFRRALATDRPDLIHGTVNYLPRRAGVPATLTLHDALGIKTYPWEGKVRRTGRAAVLHGYWHLMTRLSVGRARRVITGSRDAARELAATLNVPESRFEVVYHGLNLPAPTPGTPRRPRAALMIHAADPRKNVECVYRAFGDPKNGLKEAVACLEIVCTNGAAAERAEAFAKQYGLENYRLLRGLSDQELSDAYAGASAFLWPSRLEGFGLPPLEAMGNGCPVVSSDGPAMPEVLGNAPLYFSPDDPGALASRLRELWADPDDWRRRADAGRARAAEFSCRRMAEETVAVWKAAASGGDRS